MVVDALREKLQDAPGKTWRDPRLDGLAFSVTSVDAQVPATGLLCPRLDQSPGPMTDGHLLEAAAQWAYDHCCDWPHGFAASAHANDHIFLMSQGCTCQPTEPCDEECPWCMEIFIQELKSALRQYDDHADSDARSRWADNALAELEAAGLADHYSGIAAALRGLPNTPEYFGTPDRVDNVRGKWIGTEFKSGRATLGPAQRVMAQIRADMGMSIVVTRLTPIPVERPLKPGDLVRVPFGKQRVLAIYEATDHGPCALHIVGGEPLHTYWERRGEAVEPGEPVVWVIMPHKSTRLCYPVSIIQPVDVHMKAEEVFEAPGKPFPWTRFLGELNRHCKPTRDDRRRDAEERIAQGSPDGRDIEFMTPEQVRDLMDPGWLIYDGEATDRDSFSFDDWSLDEIGRAMREHVDARRNDTLQKTWCWRDQLQS